MYVQVHMFRELLRLVQEVLGEILHFAQLDVAMGLEPLLRPHHLVHPPPMFAETIPIGHRNYR